MAKYPDPTATYTPDFTVDPARVVSLFDLPAEVIGQPLWMWLRSVENRSRPTNLFRQVPSGYCDSAVVVATEPVA